MLKKFFVSKKLNECADLVEKNAERGADSSVKMLKALNDNTEIFGVLAQVIASVYRLLRIILTVITTDSEEGKIFRVLMVDLYKAYAKRLRDSAGFVTALTKNKKIMRAIEAFEEDMDELKVATNRRYARNKMARVDELQRKFSSMLRNLRKNATDAKSTNEADAYEKAYKKYVLAARTYLAELAAGGKDSDGEAIARTWHLGDALNTYPKVPEFCEDERGWFWKMSDTSSIRVDREKADD